MMDQIESISASFEKVDATTHYMKEQLCKMKEITPKIDFQNCHIACARNGGMMAFVRCAKFLVLDSTNPIKDSVRVFYQNGSGEKRINFKWDEDYELVIFDFTEDEQLYAVTGEGMVYKFNIFNKSFTEKQLGPTFKNDKIISAKLFEKGFTCLTEGGSFYIIKDFGKNLFPTMFFPKQEIFPHKEPIQDFVFVPASRTASHCIELYFSLDNVHGVFKVKDEPDHRYTIRNNSTKEINGVYYAKNSKDALDDEGEWRPMTQSSGRDAEDEFGQIKAIAISSNSKNIAFYSSKGTAFCFGTEFNDPTDYYYARFVVDSGDAKSRDEISKMIAFSDRNPQFMFCGDYAVCLAGGRHVLISSQGTKTLVNKMLNKLPKSSLKGFHCISECDGVRVIMNESIYLISKVSDEVYDACYPFSEEPSKRLIGAYKKANEKEASCDKDIREIENELSEAVKSLQKASAYLWKKDIQLHLLKAAQHGKNFVSKDSYNYEQFVEICKNIRIVNNLRDREYPRLITYKEFVNINPRKNIIKKLLKNNDFFLAYEISKYLDFNVKKVYEKYALAKIKSSTAICDTEETIDYNKIYEKIKHVDNISYIKLAKKAFKYKKENMGMKFLENEKSILTKIPQYLELKKWERALDLALQTQDSNVLLTVFDKILNVEPIEDFSALVQKYKQTEPLVIGYLKRTLPETLPLYLETTNNYEELILFHMENFFKSKNIEDRMKSLKTAETVLKESKKQKEPNYDIKFYEEYLNDVERSVKFKKDLLDDEVIRQTDVSTFDNSIYDCFKALIKNNRPGDVETKNQKFFKLSQKKVSILKIKTFAEMQKMQEILEIANTPAKFKSSQLSYVNFSELFMELKDKDRAAEMIKKITEPDYFDYKIEMLKYIEKFEDALEVAIKEKGVDSDKKEMLIREILSKNPGLKGRADQLLSENNVGFRI